MGQRDVMPTCPPVLDGRCQIRIFLKCINQEGFLKMQEREGVRAGLACTGGLALPLASCVMSCWLLVVLVSSSGR